ncbi:hypothetical protein [Enterococcus sp. AZ072]|uniref:hypothetical protein n=1 Tax=unclassified Enterococcus TaxID=2608891 RepID=UPI003D2BF4B1
MKKISDFGTVFSIFFVFALMIMSIALFPNDNSKTRNDRDTDTVGITSPDCSITEKEKMD